MAKTVKTTAETLAIAMKTAIDNDVALNKEARQSGATVANAFDEFFAKIDWTSYKGNMSPEKCGFNKETYKLIKTVRTAYRDAWNAAGLTNFDQRWAYVCSASKHAGKKKSDAAASKSPVQKACEAARALHRMAVEIGDTSLQAIARDACEYLGLEIEMAE